MMKSLLAVLFLSVNLVTDSEGLSCYTCAHYEKGQLAGEHKQDDSCKWDSKPDDKFLQNCLQDGEDNDEGNKFDFICTGIRVDGRSRSDRSNFVGTLRGCAARLIGTTNETTNTTMEDVTANDLQECRQGKLSVILEKFTNPTGKEYMQGINEIFDDMTTVKICACDKDACWKDNELPEEENVEDSDEEKGHAAGSMVQVTFLLPLLISSTAALFLD